MKRVLPLLLRYFAVVGVACFLALAISHTLASAEVAAPASADGGSSDAAIGFASPGVYRIASSSGTWRDTARARDVPVKLYFPLTAAAPKVAAKFPVILFSHGLGGSREGGKRWAEHWASHGFVVVAMQHPGSDEALWKSAAPRDFADNMKAAVTMANLVLRIGDVRFAIDEVIRRTEAGEAEFVQADRSRIGMSGHSFGAQTTQAVTGQKAPVPGAPSTLDARISAAVAFSPNARNKTGLVQQFGGIKLPFFFITGSEDGDVLGDGTSPPDRRLPFESVPAGQKYLAVFDGGDHMVFGGHGFNLRRPETTRDKEIQADVMAGTLAFWTANLKQDAIARRWLEEGAYRATLAARDVFERK